MWAAGLWSLFTGRHTMHALAAPSDCLASACPCQGWLFKRKSEPIDHYKRGTWKHPGHLPAAYVRPQQVSQQRHKQRPTHTSRADSQGHHTASCSCIMLFTLSEPGQSADDVTAKASQGLSRRMHSGGSAPAGCYYCVPLLKCVDLWLDAGRPALQVWLLTMTCRSC